MIGLLKGRCQVGVMVGNGTWLTDNSLKCIFSWLGLHGRGRIIRALPFGMGSANLKLSLRGGDVRIALPRRPACDQ